MRNCIIAVDSECLIKPGRLIVLVKYVGTRYKRNKSKIRDVSSILYFFHPVFMAALKLAVFMLVFVHGPKARDFLFGNKIQIKVKFDQCLGKPSFMF